MEMKGVSGEIFKMFAIFKRNWRQFLLIHIVTNGLIFIFLGPLAGALLHLVVAFSGEAALSDQDILFFLLKPVGLLSLLIVASAFSVLVFLEHAALLTLTYFSEVNESPSIKRLMVFLAQRSAALFSLAARLLLRVLLLLLPFVILMVAVYLTLLGDYDINYYLGEKPPEFLQAAVGGGLILLGLVLVLLRVFVSWFFCLPLLLINNLSPKQAIAQSQQSVVNRRMKTAYWLAGWAVFGLLGTTVIGFLMFFLGKLLLPLALNSFNFVLLVMVSLSLLTLLLNFGLSWISSSFLSIITVCLFQNRAMDHPTQPFPGNDKTRALHRFLSGRKLALALMIGLSSAALLVNSLLNRVLLEDRTEVIAHRGASAAAPENSLAAIQLAIEAGADWVEIDVQETVDGEIVVIHDSDLKKIAGQAMKVSESSLVQLQQLDIGSWFAPEFGDQRIPTLKSVLELCQGRVGVIIELKYYGREVKLEESVAEIVEAAGMQEQVKVMSLSYAGIKQMRELRPDWTLGLLSSVSLGKLNQLDVDFLALNARSASRARILSTQKQGKQMMVWTINDLVGMSNMFSRGVDGIITDEPALAVSILQQRAELEPAQRLLLHLADVFDQPSLYREQ